MESVAQGVAQLLVRVELHALGPKALRQGWVIDLRQGGADEASPQPVPLLGEAGP